MSAAIASSGVAAGRLLARGATKLGQAQFARARVQQPLLRRGFAASVQLRAKKYSRDHEWVELDQSSKTATIGISHHAADALGDVVYVELPAVDLEANQGDTIGAVESVKAASDILSPISGTVTEVNSALEDNPSLINKEPEASGWLAKIEVKDTAELDNLMDEAAYKSFTEESDN